MTSTTEQEYAKLAGAGYVRHLGGRPLTFHDFWRKQEEEWLVASGHYYSGGGAIPAAARNLPNAGTANPDSVGTSGYFPSNWP